MQSLFTLHDNDEEDFNLRFSSGKVWWKKRVLLDYANKIEVEIGEKEGRLQNWNKRAYYATTMEVFEIDWHLEEE